MPKISLNNKKLLSEEFLKTSSGVHLDMVECDGDVYGTLYIFIVPMISFAIKNKKQFDIAMKIQNLWITIAGKGLK